MIFRKIAKYVFVSILVFLAAVTIWTWASLSYVYSTGERAGYVQKFSKKGWLIKTWEGEMAMVNLPGAMPEKFLFTVREAELAEKIKKTLGHRIVLEYNQHRGLPGTLFGDTPYFVSDVRPVIDAESPEPLPAAN